MTREEALQINTVLLALLAQKQTLSIVGIGVGMTTVEGPVFEAATALAEQAHARLGAGIDPETLCVAWTDDEALDKALARIRQEARRGQKLERV